MGPLLVLLAMAPQPDCDGWFRQYFFIECATYTGSREFNEKPGSRSSDRKNVAVDDPAAVGGSVGGGVGGGKGPRLGGGGKTKGNRGVGTGSRPGPGRGGRP